MELIIRLLDIVLAEQASQISLGRVHDGLDHGFEKRVQQAGLFLVLLEDIAHPVSHFLEGEAGVSLLPDEGVGLHTFVLEKNGHVFDILDESGFLLHKEVSVLSHSFVDLLSFGEVGSDDPFVNQLFVVEGLVGFLEVEELGFDIEGSHF